MLLTIILFTVSSAIVAQDLIYTVSGELNESKIPLDSILVENISNGTWILFDDLPAHDYYQINLSKNAYWGTVGLDNYSTVQAFLITQNMPGLLTFTYNGYTSIETRLSVFNINGQKLYSSNRNTINPKNSIRVQLVGIGVFFVKLESDLGVQTFKATGSPEVKNYEVAITDENSVSETFKSTLMAGDSDFSFLVGDSIRISAYREGYYASPISFSIIESNTVNLLFSITGETGTLTDSRDGKTYNTVTIGNQGWMAENLAYLPEISPSSGGSLTEPYYYVFNYEGDVVSEAKADTNYATYGVLYNWPAAMNGGASSITNPSGVQGVCPTGFHLPSDAEWKQMEMVIGMSQSEADDTDFRGTDEGLKLRTTSGWWINYDGTVNYNGTDDFGFSGLPGGYRVTSGYFDGTEIFSHWWSSTERGTDHAWKRSIGYENGYITRDFYTKSAGFSVRCVRD
jgi:uncharacterized protein (TIGR02145 family)